MSRIELWLVLLGMGLITYVIRASFLLFAERLTLSPRLKRALRYVPAAVLAAIIAPALLLPEGNIALSGNARLLAGLAAALAAYFKRSILLTILVGMGALWLLQWLAQLQGSR